jgi:hypothetical protein
MAYIKNMPQPPVIIFAGDGSEFEVLRCVNTVKDGKPCMELVMSPFDWTKVMLDIEEKDLDYKDYNFGVLRRTYPASKILVLSQNPEKPVWMSLTTFHGTPMDKKSKDLTELFKYTEQVDRLTEEVTLLRAENKRLQKENIHYALKSKEFFETQQSFTKPQSTLMLPQMSNETEIKTKLPRAGGE